MSNQTKLTKSITSSFIGDRKLTEQNLQFADRLGYCVERFAHYLPYLPEQRSNSERFNLDPRLKETFNKMQSLINEAQNVESEISKIEQLLRNEGGQNKLEYLEEVTDLFPLQDWRISTVVENDYNSLSFNVIFPANNFPNCAKLPNIFKERKIYNKDIERCFKGLRDDRIGYRELDDLRDNYNEYKLAIKEIEALNNLLKPLHKRGFDAYFSVKSVSSRGLVCYFSLTPKSR